MKWLQLHKTRHNHEGGNIRNAYSHHTHLYTRHSLQDSPTYKQVMINDELFDTRVVTEKKFTVASGYHVKKILFEPYVEPRNGQLVYIDDEIWLTVYADSKSLAPFNYIRKCTHLLDVKVDDKIYKTPCVLETRVRNTQKLSELTYVDLSLDSLKITVPYNEYTRTIRKKDRFVIDQQAWEIQGVDKITQVENEEGIIELASKEVPLTAEEKKIYIPEPEIDPTQVILTIVGKDRIPQKAKTQYKGIVTYDGEIVEGGKVKWSSDGIIDDDGVFTATCDTGVYTIWATYDYIDGCGDDQTITAEKRVTVYNNKEWW